MIKCKVLNGEAIYLNERYIELMEANPDTTIKIHDGTTYVVQETPEEILRMMREWKDSGATGREG